MHEQDSQWTRRRIARPVAGRPGRSLIVGAVAVLALTAACNDSADAVATTAVVPVSASYMVTGATSDKVMGRLSPVALTIAAGLRDAGVMKAIAVAMKDKRSNPVGLDLQSCGSASIAAHVMAVGARNIGGEVGALCRFLGQQKGMVLYMDPDRLKAWNGETAVIVTAIEDLNAERPPHFAGYRISGEVASLPSEGSTTEPVLVVLPIPHTVTSNGPPPGGRTIQVPPRRP